MQTFLIFFYKRKLNSYNLTVHSSVGTSITTYCGIWTEGLAGRGGNHIASALIAALKKVVDDTPGLKHVILWSDSCVPQNRNSITSFALLDFLWNTPSLESIEQKFCEPHHSSIQEIDNIHSQIEKHLKLVEVYSQIFLCRVLLTVNQRRPLQVVQMKVGDFMDFHKASACLAFSNVPYAKLKHSIYRRSLTVEYKTSFSQDSFEAVTVERCGRQVQQCSSSSDSQNVANLPKPGQCPKASSSALRVEKKKDLHSMLQFMPQVN